MDSSTCAQFATRRGNVLALSLAVLLTNGCSSTAHLLSAGTTAPSEKTCTFFLGVDTSPLPSDSSVVRVSGGFDGREKEMVADVKKVYFPATKTTTWQIRGDHHFIQNAPCVGKSPIYVEIESTEAKWRAAIPIAGLLRRPVFGTFYLSINGSKARLSLAENIGKTRYSPTLMTMVWATEPLRQIAEVNLVESKP